MITSIDLQLRKMASGTPLFASVVAIFFPLGQKSYNSMFTELRNADNVSLYSLIYSSIYIYPYFQLFLRTFRFHFLFPGFTCRPVLFQVQLRWSDPGHVTMFSFPSPSIFTSWFRPRYLWPPDFRTDTETLKPTGTYSCATLPLCTE